MPRAFGRRPAKPKNPSRAVLSRNRRRLGDDHDHDDECPHSHTAMYVGIFLVVVVIGVVAGMFFTKKGCFSEDGKPAESG